MVVLGTFGDQFPGTRGHNQTSRGRGEYLPRFLFYNSVYVPVLPRHSGLSNAVVVVSQTGSAASSSPALIAFSIL